MAVTTTDESTTVVDEPVVDRAVLRPDGVGGIDFGTPADDAIAGLAAMLGAPDRVEMVEPVVADCVEGSSWLDCVLARRVIEMGRLAVWDDLGLEVALVDAEPDGSPTALQFADWQATVTSDPTRLTTTEGVSAGMTVGALKQAVPEVEFTYNEGALDSFYVWNDQTGGYWGRLDWKPATVETEYRDVAAVQSALNDHGADLDIDGIWGPRTEAAWLAFLTGQGIEPAPPQLWLTPEIGAALGLPPDHVTVATIEPRPPLDPASPAATEALPILRPDGLGPVDLGTPAEEAIAALTGLLGPPDRDDPIPSGGECVSGASWLDCRSALGVIEEGHLLVWDDVGLEVVFADSAGERPEQVLAPLNLATWRATPVAGEPGLTTVEGLYPGMTFGQLRHLVSDVQGGYDEGSLLGYRIQVPSGGGYNGALDRDPSTTGNDLDDQIRAIQAVLNTHGADLVVDGIWGPRSEAAWIAFLEQQQIEPAAPTFSPWLVPEIGDALGFPTDAMTITSISPMPS